MNSLNELSQSEKLKSLLKKTNGIIFDFDGLLADSEPYHYLAYNQIFEKYGHSLNKSEYWVEWTSKGQGIAGEIKRHNLDLPIDPIKLREQKFEVYSQYCQNGDIKLFPEAIKVARKLKANLPVAIASGSWKHDIRAILKNSGAEYLFDNILGKESAIREKPHPDIFINAAKSLHCHASQCMVIEDALKGLIAAKAANMACIIILNQLNQKIDFSEADLVFPSLSDFSAALGS